MDDTQSNYIKKAYSYNSLVYSIINYMATTGAAVSWKLEDKNGEEITDHWFLDLWRDPNPDQTLQEFIEAQLIYKYATGNTWIYSPIIQTGANKGKPAKLEVMPSHQVTPIFGSTNEIIRGVVLKGQNYDREIDVKNTLHIKYLNPDVENESPAVGMSPLKALILVITQNNDAWANLAASFQNGGPKGFFSRDGSSLEGDFTQEQGQSLIDRLRAKNSGPANANTLAAVGGNVKYQNVGLSPVDLNILEAIRVSFVQVCNAFKFPASLLNFDAALTYNNFAEAQKILWTVALKQDLDIIGQKFTNRIIRPIDPGVRLIPDYSKIEVLQKNRAEMVAWLNSAWWLKASRKQEIMGEEIDPELDKYYIPAGLIPEDFTEDPTFQEVEDNLKRLGNIKY
jgi:HK97 family phage portal protein